MKGCSQRPTHVCTAHRRCRCRRPHTTPPRERTERIESPDEHRPSPDGARAGSLRLTCVHALATKVGGLDLDVLHLVDGATENVAVEDDEVGELSRLQRSLSSFLEGEERVVDRVEADRLLACEILLGMQRRV